MRGNEENEGKEGTLREERKITWPADPLALIFWPGIKSQHILELGQKFQNFVIERPDKENSVCV